jgi:UDP-glucose 4-epimerase
LFNSNRAALETVGKISDKKFKILQCDLLDFKKVWETFAENSIDCVLHLAATKGVNSNGNSPIKFYKNNLVSTINLLDVMQQFGVKKIIFSSSCAVYGNQENQPVVENAEINLLNPYARSKHFCEEILRDVAKADKQFSIIILRYFNPVGAHQSGILGEDPTKSPLNILTLFAKHAIGKCENLTISASCVRDYIHINDVTEAHIAGIENLENFKGIKTINIGSGTGTSLQELIDNFEEICGRKINFTEKPCNEHEIKEIIASTKLSDDELNWKAKKNVADMCKDCWKFVNNFYDTRNGEK